MRCLVHRFDPVMALVAADAFCVGGGLGLIDPVLARTGRRLGERKVWRQRSGGAVSGIRFLGLSGCRRQNRHAKEEETSNVQRPTSNVQLRKARGRIHRLFCFAVRMLAAKILMSASVSM